MKKTTKILMIFLVSTFFVNNLSALKTSFFEIKQLPKNINEFLEYRNKNATKPQGGAAVLITAMLLTSNSNTNISHYYTIALERSKLVKNKNGYKGFSPSKSFLYLIDHIKKKSYIPKVYIQGTNYETGYKLPKKPLKVEYFIEYVRRNTAKIFIKTTSGNFARPIYLSRNNRGIWKVQECSSLFMDIRKLPAKFIDDDI